MRVEEEEKNVGRGARANEMHWWWTLASTAQLGWGMSSYRKGYAGDSRLMPLKAFGIASLFVGSAASASVAFLQASGIHKYTSRRSQVEDLLEVGANMRTRLGIPSRTPPHKETDDL